MTTYLNTSPRCLSDRELIDRIQDLACHEQQAAAGLIAHLAELDERRLYLAEGCSSLFTYCTEVLHLSEDAAFSRIIAARAARKFPRVLERLANGSIHLTGVRLLAQHLTEDNHRDLLDRAAHRSKREVEEIVATISPRPDAASIVRRLPCPAIRHGEPGPTLDFKVTAARGETSEESSSETDLSECPPLPTAGHATLEDRASNTLPATPKPRRTTVVALSAESYKLQCTISPKTHQKLQQARELLRHRIPGGDIAAVLDVALNMLVDRLAQERLGKKGRGTERRPRRRLPARRPASGASKAGGHNCQGDAVQGANSAATGAPERMRPTVQRSPSRYIPKHTRRKVWSRDGGRCAFIAQNGRRCSERGRLEFHHVKPFALGGPSSTENLELRCRAHNAHEADTAFRSGWREPVPGQCDCVTSTQDSG